MKLTTLERKILFDFLKQLSDHMGNAGCNDYCLKNTPEAQALVRAVIEDQFEGQDRKERLESLDHDIENGRKQLIEMDFIILHYLEKKLKQILDEAENGH